ncbi:MAG TPA: FHA domain-containing protein [Myxococcota bacterium]|nr:FHA domain-containing protein [Myxococcota bacterium]
MEATVVFRLPDGARASLTHGDLIGRLETAALHLDDPRVSEAHAMVSLRGAVMKLLALRGRIAVDGFPLRDVELRQGLVVQLAEDFALLVERVVLPDEVVGLVVDGAPLRVVTSVWSVLAGGVKVGYLPEAAAWVWPTGPTLTLRRRGGDDELLEVGAELAVEGVALRVEAIDMGRGRSFATTDHGRLAVAEAPLEILARYTSVHIRRAGAPTIVIAGLAARVVSELVASGVPMPWSALAAEIWPDMGEVDLRARWDVTMSRLRKKLVTAGLRADLIRSDGHGNLELCLGPGDVARDEC